MPSSIRSTRALLAAFAALSGFLSFSNAQSVATTPVGAFRVPILASSDTIVAIPLQEQNTFQGAVSSPSVSGGNLTINLSSNPGWTANQFQSLYYVRLLSGTKAGQYFTVLSNGSQSLQIDGAGADLSTVAAGDSFLLCKYWTLNTLLPYNDLSKNPLTVSASTTGPARRSQVIIPNNAFQGINLPAQGTYYFTSTGWKKAGDGTVNYDNTVLLPDEYIVIRQPASISTDTSLTMTGGVYMNSLVIPMATRAAGTQDNALALLRPADVTLAASGLASGFLASASTTGPARRDQLFIFDNAVRSFNKSASKTYFMVGTEWRQTGLGTTNVSNDLIPAGSGVVVRKYQNASATVANWTNTANY
jgi:uncharacterized protein (TIGR02597 family)